jgi:hypothetical protein
MLFFEMLKKKIWANFQRIVEVFTQKIFNMLSNIWVWDPGSEIRDPEKTYSGCRIPDPGVKKAPDPGSGSATLQFLHLDPDPHLEIMRIRIQQLKKMRIYAESESRSETLD